MDWALGTIFLILIGVSFRWISSLKTS